MKSEKYKEDYIALNESVIEDIFNLLEKANAGNISLNTGLIYNFIDDQSNEVIREIDYHTRNVVIDGSTYDYRMSINGVPVGTLIAILEAIELEDYEIFEELNQ